MKRLQITIQGHVQGVGFRPCVYRVAKFLHLAGAVLNDANGVTIEVQGEHAEKFVDALQAALPPLASIESYQIKQIPFIQGEETFEIIHSQSSGEVTTKIMPDVCTCQDCLKELFDEQSRFYLYPFLNCTNCGPRLTIVENLPYDRKQTTMRDFSLCDPCEKDYSNPENRRYHAQPTACTTCGPQLSMPIKEIVAHLQRGDIVAVKGMGGYQLICDATNEAAVKKLRQRKHRDSKPFALMVLNSESAKQFININETEQQLLESWQRPIVLLKKKKEVLPKEIAKGLSELGMMIPYTPIHYLLFHGLLNYPKGSDWLNKKNNLVLIATSANISGEPLIIDDDDAKIKLKDIADVIVSYNRKILTRVDDSVARIIDGTPYFIRRARGYVPMPIKLSRELPHGLALGGLLKNTVCIIRGNEAFVSQYLGDMDEPETIDFFHETIRHLLQILDVKPTFIAHDLHPDFYTTRFSHEYGDVKTIAVQHHHAHLASVAAEHHILKPTLGLALDGYGYGKNGGAWGGELMRLNGADYDRIGHLKEIPQPGGDIAAKEPWRMATTILHLLNQSNEAEKRFNHHAQLQPLQQLLKSDLALPMTSSCGRLFDAASALLGVVERNSYEGEAAMWLESLVTQPKTLKDGWSIENNQLNLLPLFNALLQVDQQEGANFFHGTLIAAITEWLVQNAQANQMDTILLSGGCFLNKVLTEGLLASLRKHKLNPLLPRQLPPNDGCISLGQAWIAGLM